MMNLSCRKSFTLVEILIALCIISIGWSVLNFSHEKTIKKRESIQWNVFKQSFIRNLNRKGEAQPKLDINFKASELKLTLYKANSRAQKITLNKIQSIYLEKQSLTKSCIELPDTRNLTIHGKDGTIRILQLNDLSSLSKAPYEKIKNSSHLFFSS